MWGSDWQSEVGGQMTQTSTLSQLQSQLEGESNVWQRAPLMSEVESSPMRVLLSATVTYWQQEMKMPFHGNQVWKLLGISSSSTTALFKKNIKTNTRKLGVFTSLKSSQVPSPEEEGITQLRDKEIMLGYPTAERNFTLRHQRSPSSHDWVCQDFSTNLHIREIPTKLPLSLPWELKLCYVSPQNTKDTDLFLPLHFWSKWPFSEFYIFLKIIIHFNIFLIRFLYYPVWNYFFWYCFNPWHLILRN